MKHFETRLNELALLSKLNFSRQELLNEAAIGFDAFNKKLLLLSGNNESSCNNQLFDLADIKSCTLIREYGYISASGSKKVRMENYLRRIALRFEFNNGEVATEVDFYHHLHNEFFEAKEAISRAKEWEALLSGAIKKQNVKAA